MTTRPDAIAMNSSDVVRLTDEAAKKVKELLATEDRSGLRLRITIQPGGCSGLNYQLSLDDRTLSGDTLITFNGFEVAIDQASSSYLRGAEIDYADTSDHQGFTIDNPNIAGSCACGDSSH
ncbi:iron-sulfur cluster assembly accessory protein [Streptomyces sp. NPDC002265]|uniref:HesB/IscA family protein n=1 Tax=Streptomyces sp. NPDC002265 TaxID=3154415 RepID=UPI003321B543